MKIVRTHIIFGLVIMLAACGRSAWIEQYVSMPDARWHLDSAAVFTFQVPDTSNSYDLEILLRSNENFPYSNLYLFLTWEGNSGVMVDTLQHLMALPEGKWTGQGYGALKENVIRYKMNYRFEKNEKVRLSVAHGMRDVYLKGVEDIGFRITLSQEKSSK